jgi:carboxypeptidase Q
MRVANFVLVLGLIPFLGCVTSNHSSNESARLIVETTKTDFAYKRLCTLCDKFGSRFSGSSNLEAAIDWVLAEMKKDGLENVHGEPVMVPHWVRGKESAELISPRHRVLPMLSLGGSVATPPEGITAQVLVVRSFDELKQRASEAYGRIVLFNQPFETYHKTILIRRRGAIEAARVGAVASMIRSVAPFSMQTPHTGGMAYSNDVPKIPHIAITPEDADLMQRMEDRGERVVVKLSTSAQTLPDAPSRNVVAELVGREKPDEIVVVSGHIDSWDVGQGAMDDGGGCVAAWEAVRIMKQLGMRPRRTIRVVLWVNEENGLRGARTYVKDHKAELAKHVLAIESDQGTFKPRGFEFKGRTNAFSIVKKIGEPLRAIGVTEFKGGADEADVAELVPDGVPIADLIVHDEKYFWYHHTEADTPDKLNAKEVSECAAALAVLAYGVADAPEALPR